MFDESELTAGAADGNRKMHLPFAKSEREREKEREERGRKSEGENKQTDI